MIQQRSVAGETGQFRAICYSKVGFKAADKRGKVGEHILLGLCIRGWLSKGRLQGLAFAEAGGYLGRVLLQLESLKQRRDKCRRKADSTPALDRVKQSVLTTTSSLFAHHAVSGLP